MMRITKVLVILLCLSILWLLPDFQSREDFFGVKICQAGLSSQKQDDGYENSLKLIEQVFNIVNDNYFGQIDYPKACRNAEESLIVFTSGKGQAAEKGARYTDNLNKDNFLDFLKNLYTDYARNKYPEKDKKLLAYELLSGFAGSLDEFCAFFQPGDMEKLRAGTKEKFGGLGIVVAMRDGVLTVVAPLAGTPADRAGIEAGDRIIRIDGKTLSNLKLWEAVDLMRGPEGTGITLTIQGKDNSVRTVALERAEIPIKSVFYKTLSPGYGYVKIVSFRDNTASDLKNALKSLESENSGLKGIILDLRNNPGGLLSGSISSADLFMKTGTIARISGKTQKHTRQYEAKKDYSDFDLPVVVLMNSGTASGAEILASAFQDNRRALLLGDKSYGKGSIQTIEPLMDGSALKLTIAGYLTPLGREIQGRGIMPDVELDKNFESKAINFYGNFDAGELLKDNYVFLAYKTLENTDSKNLYDLVEAARAEKKQRSAELANRQEKHEEIQTELKESGSLPEIPDDIPVPMPGPAE